jgi:predicted PurR-regulated permease PerM
MTGADPYWKKIAVAAAIAAATILFLLLLWVAGQVLLLAFAGVLLAIFLNTLAGWLSRTGLGYGWSLAVVIILLIAAVVGIGWLVGNRLAGQFNELTATLPRSLHQIHDYLKQSTWGQWLLDHFSDSTLATPGVSQIAGAASTTMTVIVDIVVILFVGIYGAAEPDMYLHGMVRLVPLPQRQRATHILETVAFNLRWWLFGQLFAMLVIGVAIGLALWLIGMPLALALGVLAGVLEIVPNIGPLLWLVPALLVALTQGPTAVIYMFALYAGIHMFESYVLIPIVQRRMVWLPPALSILTLILLSLLAGVLGLFIAAPLTVVAMVLTELLYVEDFLGDRTLHVLGEHAAH